MSTPIEESSATVDASGWYERGLRAGEIFEDPEPVLSGLEQRVRGQLFIETKELREELANKKALLKITEDRLHFLDDMESRVSARREEIDAEREQLGSEYSLVKGLLYMSLAVFLLLADLSLLGQVSAEFLGYEWRSRETGESFSEILFSRPVEALEEFPDLFWLTLAVLLMGLFVKVWRDAWLATQKAPRDAGKTLRWDFYMFSLLAFLALGSVVLMAAARLVITFGDSGLFGRGVSAFLGLALPLISAGFFVKGYDAVTKRWTLTRNTFRHWLLVARTKKQKKNIELLRAEISLMESEFDSHNDEKKIDVKIKESRASFLDGYREGMSRLLDFEGKEGLVSGLRPLIAKRKLARATYDS